MVAGCLKMGNLAELIWGVNWPNFKFVVFFTVSSRRTKVRRNRPFFKQRPSERGARFCRCPIRRRDAWSEDRPALP